jgi:hypothetical protein
MTDFSQTVDFDKFKVRCSSIHAALAGNKSNPCLTENQATELNKLEQKKKLTEKQKEQLAELLVKKENGKKIILSDTYIEYLMEEYAWQTRGMVRVSKEILDVPQMSKGTAVEPDSLELLSIVDRVVYMPNQNELGERERVSNDFISGEVDAYVGDRIMTATIIPDIKSIWDLPTFLCKIMQPLTVANDFQLKGYGLITGAQDLFVANCLINTPSDIQYDIRERLKRKLKVFDDDSPVLAAKWSILEKSMEFDHIPAHQRVFKKKVEPINEFQKQLLYDRVRHGRDFLWQFHEQYQKLNKAA